MQRGGAHLRHLCLWRLLRRLPRRATNTRSRVRIAIVRTRRRISAGGCESRVLGRALCGTGEAGLTNRDRLPSLGRSLYFEPGWGSVDSEPRWRIQRLAGSEGDPSISNQAEVMWRRVCAMHPSQHNSPVAPAVKCAFFARPRATLVSSHTHEEQSL